MAIYLVPRKQSVVERFPLLGEFVIRGSSAYIHKVVNFISSIFADGQSAKSPHFIQ